MFNTSMGLIADDVRVSLWRQHRRLTRIRQKAPLLVKNLLLEAYRLDTWVRYTSWFKNIIFIINRTISTEENINVPYNTQLV